MRYKNSFFVIEIKNDGTYMHLYPPKAGGKSLEISEVKHFLERHEFIDFSIPAIKSALERLGDEQVCLKISDSQMEPFHEQMVLDIEESGMVAYARFYPPSVGGATLTKEDILSSLKLEKITYGIQEQVIDIFLQARQYCLDIPIAKAKKPVHADSSQITYHFNTKPLGKPKHLEDGSVDFHDLNLFCPVHKGDLLATLKPHTLGEPGINIFGKTIPQNRPVIRALKYSKNITISEDKCQIFSDVDGNVSLVDDTVFVADVFQVPADVDASTGDINYEGSVEVAGMVRSGFSVRAKGDIVVNGGVEGATLIAGGNIVIKRGVQGMGKGELRAGGDIGALFFESAHVYAKGDVQSGSILSSYVVSGGKVIASGRKGYIVGGEVCCKNYLEATSIGNKMETQTNIKVGVEKGLFDKMKKIMARITDIKKEQEDLVPVIIDFKDKLQKNVKLPSDKLKHFIEIQQQYVRLNQEKEEATAQFNTIREEINNASLGMIKVTGAAYRGTTLFISKYVYSLKDNVSHSVFKVSEGEIRSSGF